MQMRSHRAQRNAELVRNLFIKKTLRQQGQDFLLPFRELFRLSIELLNLVKVVHHLAGDLHGHRGSPGIHLLDRLDQLRRGHVFEEVTAGAVTQ